MQLVDAHKADPARLMQRVEVLRATPAPHTDERVAALLLSEDSGATVRPATDLLVGGKKVGSYQVGERGGVRVALSLPPLPASRREAVIRAIQQALEVVEEGKA